MLRRCRTTVRGMATAPLAMEGMAKSGEYAANSLSQQQCFRLVVPRALAALERAPGRPVLADFGAADGAATLQLLDALGDDPALDVVVSDLEGNDWDAAAAILGARGRLRDLPAADGFPERGGEGLRLYAAPGSFHARVLPEGSVDAAVSGTAFHWLSDTSSLPPPGSISSTNDRNDRAIFAKWRDHAHADFVGLLAARAFELRPGGALTAVLPARLDDGSRVYQVLLDSIDDLLAEMDARGDLAAGFIDRLSREAASFPLPPLGPPAPQASRCRRSRGPRRTSGGASQWSRRCAWTPSSSAGSRTRTGRRTRSARAAPRSATATSRLSSPGVGA